MKKKLILNLILELYRNTKNIALLYIDNKHELKRIEKYYYKEQKFYAAVINFKKFKIVELWKIFFILSKYFGINKNFLIFFNFEKQIVAYNIFPDWPGKYKFFHIAQNLTFWTKRIISTFINYKSINFIVIKFK